MDHWSIAPPDSQDSIMSTGNHDAIVGIRRAVDAVHVVRASVVSRLHATIVTIVFANERITRTGQEKPRLSDEPHGAYLLSKTSNDTDAVAGVGIPKADCGIRTTTGKPLSTRLPTDT